MPNKNNKDKHKKKDKKEKSKKHKKEKSVKHKKEKIKEKSKNSNIKSDSSDLSSSDLEAGLKNESEKKCSERPEWGFLDTVLSDSFVTVKEKKEKLKRPTPERPGQNIRELNPYWKDGGCGLPPAKSETIHKIEKKISDQNSSSYHRDYPSYKNRCSPQPESGSEKKKLNFLKPGEKSNSEQYKNVFRGNWRKKEVQKSEVAEEEKIVTSINDNQDKCSKPITNEDLNKLAAKLVKAEIMGNTSLVNKLKLELEAAKKAKQEASEKELEGKSKEVVIVTDGALKKSHDEKPSHIASKRQKLSTHDSGQRICYFADDNKYSLKNLFEKEKETSQEDIMLPLKIAGKSHNEIDDIYLEAAASNKMQQKIEERRKQKEVKKAVVKHEALEGCCWCLDNRNTTKHLIVSYGSKSYLCLPEQESLTEGHCLIVPLQHEISMMHLDEDVWNEIKLYQKVLTKLFLEQKRDVVFFENARSFKHYPHCFIQCVPLSKEMGDVAPIYFQKAIAESESEWSNNKKVIDFRQKDLRRSIPKGLPYFAVTFGTSGGFAHIIEDEYLFKKNFAEEILGGMMDLDHTKWRKQQKDSFRVQRQKALEFLKTWKKFEFNEKTSDFESSCSE